MSDQEPYRLSVEDAAEFAAIVTDWSERANSPSDFGLTAVSCGFSVSAGETALPFLEFTHEDHDYPRVRVWLTPKNLARLTALLQSAKALVNLNTAAVERQPRLEP